MAQQQETPIYWDQHSSRWNLTLIFSAVVAVLGFVTAQFLLVILGLAMAAFSWFTTPRQYLLFRDRMTIIYGMPRTRVLSFTEISHAEVLALPFGHRLRLVMVAGNRMMLPMRDPMAFRNHLEEALGHYRGEQTGEYFVDSTGTLLGAPEEGAFGEQGAVETEMSEEEARAAFYRMDPAEPETYSGTVHEASSTSGSYVEVEEPAIEPADVEPAPAERPSSASGSYTESAEPDFSGDGTPAYSAEVELDTSASDKPEEERPPSPY